MSVPEDEEVARAVAAAKETRAKSTVRGGEKAVDGKFKKLMLLDEQQKLPALSSSRLSHIARRNDDGAPVNSLKYLRSQWADVNILTQDRRQFVRNFAKKQLEPNEPPG